MIERAAYYNYQSHKKSVLNFHRGMNVIIGVSDSGKTALIRGLEWAVWNTPSGSAFRSHWGGLTKVEITTDGKVIVRSKDKSDLYKVDDLEFKTFGRKVPEEVSLAFNMDTVNLQKQLDQPFLLAESSGAVAKYLNKIANISKIDESLAAIKSDKTKLANKISYEEEKILEKADELTEFDYLVKMKEEIDSVKNKQVQHKDIQQSFYDLGYLVVSIDDNRDKLNEIKELQKDEELIQTTLRNINKHKNLKADTEGGLNIIINRLAKNKKQREEHKELLEDAELVESTLGKMSQQTELDKDIETLTNIIENHKWAVKSIGETRLYRIELESSLPDVCPFCGSKMTKKHNHGKSKNKQKSRK